MIKIDVTPLQKAIQRKGRLEKDYKDRDDALLEKINKAVSEKAAQDLQVKRDQLKRIYDPSFSGVKEEINKAEEYIRVQKELIREKEKAYEETLKAKAKANLSFSDISDEKFEELWSTIRDRMIIEDAVSGDQNDRSKNPLTL